MTKKVYRTAQGKVVDIGALMLQNEQTRAVGNMKVNARGDKVDASGKPVSTRNQQVTKAYNRQINTANTPVHSSAKAAQAAQAAELEKQQAAEAKAIRQAKREAAAAGAEVPATNADAPLGGLAAAMAKAQQINDE